MTYQRVVPKVILAHVALLILLVVLPLLRSCPWFKKPPLETIEIDLSSLPPPPPPPDSREQEEEEEESVIPDATPIPTAQPTARPTPTATPTPAPEATVVPTATPRPFPTPTPTPKPRYLTPEEIRARIEQQQNDPEPLPTARPLSPEELRQMMGQGLPPVSDPGQIGPGAGGGSAGVSFGGVASVLKNKLYSAWNQPRNLSAASGVEGTAEVVVSKDGRISSARLKERSGITEFDRSVEAALSSVTFAKPLPAEYDGASRTFLIVFELTR